MTSRRLALRREALAPLSEAGLAAVHAGTVQELARVTSKCPSFPVWECAFSATPTCFWTVGCG